MGRIRVVGDSRILLVLFMLMGAGTDVLAQGGVTTLEFSFSNPGARSLGLGGAFAALADDATAAFANPGGLVQLTRPEISIEGRARADLTPGGGLAGSVAALSGVGFLSFAYPRGDWSLAFYWHQLADVESFFGTQFSLGNEPRSGSMAPVVNTETFSEVEIATYGVSGAYRLTESLSLGLGAVYFNGKIRSRTDFISYSDPSFGTEPTTGSETLNVDDSDWGVRAGFLWHISKGWNLGGFYRQAPSFEAEAERRTRPAETASDVAIRYPDAFGVGVAFKSSSGALAVSAEWEHVRYSTATTSFSEGIELSDGDEVHMGLEYVFLGITPIVALRGGAWFDPEPEVRVGSEGSPQSFRRGDLWHVAFGAGFAFPHVQVDLGFDVAEAVVTVSLSGVFSF